MDIESYLQNLSLPEVKLTQHKKLLKEHLLSSYDKTTGAHQKKGGDIQIMIKNLKTVRGVIILTIAVLILSAVLFTAGTFTARPVSAQELMDKVIRTVSDLTPEEREQIEKQFKADLENSLKEAYTAKDLRIVPESEIVRGEPEKDAKGFFIQKIEKEEITHGGNQINGEGDQKGLQRAGKPMVPEGITLLRYTDPQGRTVTIGITTDNKPILKMVELSEADVKEGKVIHLPAMRSAESSDNVQFEYKRVEE